MEFRVINSPESVEELVREGYLFGGEFQQPSLLDSDFEHYFFIAAYHPWRPSGGYAVEILDIVARPPLIDSGKLHRPTLILVHAKQIGPPETGVVHGDQATSWRMIVRVERPPRFEYPPIGQTNVLFGLEQGQVVFRFFVEKEVGGGIEQLAPYPSSEEQIEDITLALEEVFSSSGGFWANRKYPPEEGEVDFKVINNPEAVDELIQEGYLFGHEIQQSSLTDNDFERYFFIAAYHPWRPSTGYIIELVDVIARPPLIDSGKLFRATWILVYAKQLGPPKTGVVQGDLATAFYTILRVERPPEFEYPPIGSTSVFYGLEQGQVVFRFFLEKEVAGGIKELSPL